MNSHFIRYFIQKNANRIDRWISWPRNIIKLLELVLRSCFCLWDFPFCLRCDINLLGFDRLWLLINWMHWFPSIELGSYSACVMIASYTYKWCWKRIVITFKLKFMHNPHNKTDGISDFRFSSSKCSKRNDHPSV